MFLEIPITYNSEKIEKFGRVLLKIGKFIFYLVLIFGAIYGGYKYYITKDLFFNHNWNSYRSPASYL